LDYLPTPKSWFTCVKHAARQSKQFQGRGIVIVIETGAGLCPECRDQKHYRYQLVDMTNADRARADRLWLCPLRHSERDVDDRRRRNAS
jgi:adenosyl cobinamide kinase/adenosyl cobinamide phosphate guanylyltransferase